MATLPSDGADFTLEETEALEQDGIFLANLPGETTATDKRRVSASLLSPPTSTSSVSSPSSGASVRLLGYDAKLLQEGSFEMPASSISAAALEFIGFTPSAAKAIYDRYQDRPDPGSNNSTLFGYARGSINQIEFATYPAREAMTRAGLTADFQDRLLDPRFSEIFGTEKLLFWVLETLRTSYRAFERLQERLWRHVELTRPGGGAPHHPAPPPPSEGAAAAAAVAQTPEGHMLPADFAAVEAAPAAPAHHVVLYKGMAADMLRGSWFQEGGRLHTTTLASWEGGDFSRGAGIALYWTPQRGVAEAYRAWAAHRCPWSETWLVRICVPAALIGSLACAYLRYSRDWKEYVWHCRKKLLAPARFGDLGRWDGAVSLIRGHVCTKLAQQLARVREEDVQSAMDESFVMRDPGTGAKATQWAFVRSDAIDRLETEIRGRIHIDVTAALPAQQQACGDAKRAEP